MSNLNLMAYFVMGGVLTGLLALILGPSQRHHPPSSNKPKSLGDDLSRVDFTGSHDKYR
jgi:hypothetical protein